MKLIITSPLDAAGPTHMTPSQNASAGGDAFSKALQNAQLPPAAASVAGSTSVNPMLLYEIGLSERHRRDRDARGRGKALLEALTELQRLALGAENAESTLDRIAGLLLSVPQAADPGLASIVRGIAVRATVEVCRRRPA